MSFPKDEMQSLWAPWRVQYYERTPGEHGDFLLNAAQAPAGSEAEHLLLLRGRHCFVIMNKYPYSAGHLMVVPCRKVAEMQDLSVGEVAELWDFSVRCQQALKKIVRAAGFNIGFNIGSAAGAGKADHLHLHVVPRWDGDHNFMAVLGATRILPEALQPLYERLLPEFEGILGRGW